MKKIITLSVLALVFALQTKAQQIPLYSQQYFMRMLYNPALTAYNGSSNIYGFYREQWTGMPGHPVTRGAMGEISVWKDRSGVGFHVYNDNTDIIHRVNAQLYYAQKVRFAKDHTLSLGVSLGIMQTRIDFNNVVANDIDDNSLLGNAKGGVGFDMNVGLAYQWKKLTLSFAIPQVLNMNARVTSQLKESKYSMKRHFIGGVSYEISIKKETWNIEPSILVKKGAAQPVQVDANIMANYKRMVFLGAGYRLDYGVTMQAAVRIAKAVTIGYAYEYPIMKKVQYSSTQGTHEVILGLNFDKWLKKDNKNPEETFAKQSQYDSLAAEVVKMKENQDSTKQALDSLQAETSEQGAVIEEQKKAISGLEEKVTNLESEVAAYKKQVADRPTRDFPTTVDDNTTASQGDILRLNSVNFERNSAELSQSSFTELDKVAKFLKNNKGMRIQILGHTDYKASDEYNDWLSRSRAKTVYDYLTKKGIPGSRMVTIGMGKRAPIADNETEEGRAKNRRVEVKIVEIVK
ncbi:MAG TPA: PorP/SprF family type IX secretion system membrane protein [Chitinophagales bacterium]|nr:PorP/SprF family type IX secretion system membrane protein [Chitinophagales bacterium]